MADGHRFLSTPPSFQTSPRRILQTKQQSNSDSKSEISGCATPARKLELRGTAVRESTKGVLLCTWSQRKRQASGRETVSASLLYALGDLVRNKFTNSELYGRPSLPARHFRNTCAFLGEPRLYSLAVSHWEDTTKGGRGIEETIVRRG